MRAFPCLLAMLWAAAAQAQIIVPEQPVQLGARIAVVVQVPEGADVDVAWEWADEAGIEVTGKNRALLFTTTPGTKSIGSEVTTYRSLTVLVPDPEHPDDVTKFKRETLRIAEGIKRHHATFPVVGSGPAPPDPDVDPDVPPKPGTLGALVPDAKHRALLAEFYSDWATNIRSGVMTTTGNFRTAHASSSATLKKAGKLPDAPQLNKPISDMLAAAVGLEDAPLDVAKREALATALDAIALSLRGA